jgi:plasmid stability protein
MLKSYLGDELLYSIRDAPQWQRVQVAMTITIELPPELEAELKTQAAQQGMELETLVVETLRQDLLRRRTPSNEQLRALAAKLPPPNWFDAEEERLF